LHASATALASTSKSHCAAVSLYVAHYNSCHVHESLRRTPAMALGIADRVLIIGDLIDAAMATANHAGFDDAESAEAVPGN
jgi:hypothetical protein